MKKLFTALLCLIMLVAFPMTAFAATVNTDNAADSKEVKGTYSGSSAAAVYKVDITWGSMEFTYNEGSKGEWDPEAHQYKNTSAGIWSCVRDANKITVSNSSNADITVNLSYAAATGYNNVTAAFTDDKDKAITSLSIGSADNNLGEGEGVGKALTGIGYLNITGGKLTAEDKNVTLGTVIVELD